MPMVPFRIKLQQDLKRAVEGVAKVHGVSAAQLIRDTLMRDEQIGRLYQVRVHERSVAKMLGTSAEEEK